jgi:hypothetical protein
VYISVFGQLAFPFAIILSHTFFFLRSAAAAAAVSICNPDSLLLLSFLRYDYARYSLLIYFSFILYRHTFVCLFAPFPDIFFLFASPFLLILLVFSLLVYEYLDIHTDYRFL